MESVAYGIKIGDEAAMLKLISNGLNLYDDLENEDGTNMVDRIEFNQVIYKHNRHIKIGTADGECYMIYLTSMFYEDAEFEDNDILDLLEWKVELVEQRRIPFESKIGLVLK